MARADFPSKKQKAIPVYPIFRVECSMPRCTQMVREERADNGRNLDAVKLVALLRRLGWSYEGFGLAFCHGCRHKPDRPSHVVEMPQPAPPAWVDV